jgi:hypothetical protein
VLLETAVHLLRRFADQVVVSARARAEQAGRAGAPTGPPADHDASPEAATHPVQPTHPADTSHSMQWGAGRPGALDEVPVLRRPVTWVVAVVGVGVLARVARRRRRPA